MSVTKAANTIILVTVVANTIDNIDVISLSNSSGEFFRKIPSDIEVISPQKKRYTFYLNENEGNDTITKISLFGNGASTTSVSGTEMATQILEEPIPKNNTSSLYIEWLLEVI